MNMWSPPCPQCGQYGAEPVSFTWWGGMLGPRLLHHVRCPYCRTEFNGRTGQSNHDAIIRYLVIGTVLVTIIGGILGYVLFFL